MLSQVTGHLVRLAAGLAPSGVLYGAVAAAASADATSDYDTGRALGQTAYHRSMRNDWTTPESLLGVRRPRGREGPVHQVATQLKFRAQTADETSRRRQEGSRRSAAGIDCGFAAAGDLNLR
jgi:hypothetical protein